jgi:hypothetical protein
MLGVETRERELSAFPTNHHQKIVLTLDAGQANYNGIEQLSLIDWLLDC